MLAFHQERRRIQDTLQAIFNAGKLAARDRRLAAELAYGACRHLITLDHLIGMHATRPVSRIDPLILQILRVSLYQLVFLDRTADFAAVHQAVEQTRNAGDRRLAGASGFVNAVLRNIQRNMQGTVSCDRTDLRRAGLPIDKNVAFQFKADILPDPAEETSAYLSLAFAHPVWLIDRWLKHYDQEAVRDICLADNSRPVLTLRPNALRTTCEGLARSFEQARLNVSRVGSGLQLYGPAAVEDLPGFREGLFSVQDATAMSVAPLLNCRPGWRVLDLCAAPGGKTTHLAELMGNDGEVIACDISDAKLRLIEENCRRLGITIVQTLLIDQLEDVGGRHGPFDAILLDVPCSNTGVLARRVEVRHTLEPVAFDRLAAVQMRLLQQAGRLVKPAGRILYSTCSIDPVENERLIRAFLSANPSFHLDHEVLTLPDPFRGGGYAALLGAR